jgi:transposase
MATRFVRIDRETPLLLPPDLRDWVPSGHLAHYILDAVEEVEVSGVRTNERGTGSEQYPPRMLLGLLIYSYATGVFSSRRIEQSTYDNVAARLLTADTHPDHDTICVFRRENQALLTQAFVRVLELAQALKILQVGQITVSVDGTKVLANASKHAAVSYARAGKAIEQLELEVQELVAKAEAADSAPLQDGLTIPAEIARRQERRAQLARARAEIEARAQARAQAERLEYERKLRERNAKLGGGKGPYGPPPTPPDPQPRAEEQHNFTDPESRIMKGGNSTAFAQCYNAQAAVEVQSRLIVGARVSTSGSDGEQLVPTVHAIVPPVGPVAVVLADRGFYSEKAVKTLEGTAAGRPTGLTVYTAAERVNHHRTVADLEKRPEPAVPPPDADMGTIMRYRLATAAGRAAYKLRQQTVEPVFGIIKEAMGFRRFRLRGRAKVTLEWTLVTLAYNLRRLHRLQQATPA